MTDLIRAFIAIKLPEFVLAKVLEIQNIFKSKCLHITWVKPENIHLTLKFLGDIEPDDIELVVSAMTECSKHDKMNFFVKGAGVFPDLRRPRVLWLGIAGDIKKLIAFQKNLDLRLFDSSNGRFKPEERPFSGHITIGRIKDRIDSAGLINAIRHIGLKETEAFTADALYLIQSRLTSSGPVYTTLKKASFSARI